MFDEQGHNAAVTKYGSNGERVVPVAVYRVLISPGVQQNLQMMLIDKTKKHQLNARSEAANAPRDEMRRDGMM